MSSTSSSDDCDYCQCFDAGNDYERLSYYGRTARNSRHGPFSSTVDHPLIYFAEVINRGYEFYLKTLLNGRTYFNQRYTLGMKQHRNTKTRQRPISKRQKNEQSRKENRNCFVKAFKWYTQERGPRNEARCDGSPERCGFANWLDVKYVEYLKESHNNQVYEINAQATTTINPCSKCPSPYEPCTIKKIAQIISPRKKRRRPCKDSGDVPDKSTNQSCEFIMQPKDLTRAASDCCYQTTTSGNNKSNATVTSSCAPGTTKGMVKSCSLSSINATCCETTLPKHIDVIPCNAQEGSKTKEPCGSFIKTLPRHEQMQQVPSKYQKADVACQCPEEKLIRVNAQTQYDIKKSDMPSLTDSITCCICAPPPPTPNVPTPSIPSSTSPSSTKDREKSQHDLKRPRIPSPPKNKLKKASKLRQIFCECPKENIVTADFECQCPSTSEVLQNVCCSNVGAPNQDNQQTEQVLPPMMMRRQSCTTVTVSDAATCSGCVLDENKDVKETKQVVRPKAVKRHSYNAVPEVFGCKCTVKQLPPPSPPVNKTTRSVTSTCSCIANNGAQTSDHSISLENVKYPLFLKIVCADKLRNERYPG